MRFTTPCGGLGPDCIEHFTIFVSELGIFENNARPLEATLPPAWVLKRPLLFKEETGDEACGLSSLFLGRLVIITVCRRRSKGSAFS